MLIHTFGRRYLVADSITELAKMKARLPLCYRVHPGGTVGMSEVFPQTFLRLSDQEGKVILRYGCWVCCK